MHAQKHRPRNPRSEASTHVREDRAAVAPLDRSQLAWLDRSRAYGQYPPLPVIVSASLLEHARVNVKVPQGLAYLNWPGLVGPGLVFLRWTPLLVGPRGSAVFLVTDERLADLGAYSQPPEEVGSVPVAPTV